MPLRGEQLALIIHDYVEKQFSLVQVMAFFIAWAGCWLPIAIICAYVVNWRPSKPLNIEQKLPLLASLYLIAPLILWGATWVLDASFSDYGFAWNPWILRSAGAGFSYAVMSLVVLFGIQTALGWVTWQAIVGQQLASVLLTLVLAASISGIEELVFRGFVLTQLEHDYRPWAAAAISSVIFALLHLVWEQEETVPQLAGLWLMGMILVFARYVDAGSLGLAWGLHTGWVWAIATLDSAQLITYTGISPEWMTGKNGKPLAGAAGILFLLATGGILWWFSS